MLKSVFFIKGFVFIQKTKCDFSNLNLYGNQKKESLYLCVGSACHHKGAYFVLPKLTELLNKNGYDNRIELKGSFCLGPCTDGIVVKYKEKLILKISPENVEQKFFTEIVPVLNEN